ncbi:hypothetical protein [Parasphingorhabdus sp.]|uniref:hypothetical protein n=1 Tax=Parasphingorhabdus sp. TaxID=2709688 RepID=UPI003264942D
MTEKYDTLNVPLEENADFKTSFLLLILGGIALLSNFLFLGIESFFKEFWLTSIGITVWGIAAIFLAIKTRRAAVQPWMAIGKIWLLLFFVTAIAVIFQNN